MNVARDERLLRPHACAAWCAVACVAALCVLGARAADASRGEFGARVAPPRCRIDLSTAPVEELALLPEVGPSLAARIAADRAVRGPFRAVDEVVRVKGIGEHTLQELRESARASAR